MQNPGSRRSVRWRLVCLTVLTAFAVSPVRAQSAATAAPTAAQLAQYDKNKDGTLDSAETAAMNADTVSTTATPSSPEDIITLSPFEISGSSSDVGYYASQSLSGTRLNSKLEDLAASITVVTKQELLDTAAVDVNDVFLYESNTEGLYQYTEFVQDRSFYNEVTSLNPQQANRIRGIGSANMARGNFAASSIIPIDTYNLDSVEISRGPNANIFGLGNAAGTVNINVGRASLDRPITQFSVRGDSYGGFRTTLDVNRPLIKDRVGLRVAAVHESKGYERKPSFDSTNRLTLGLTVKPFKSTTLRATYESWHNTYQRPNTTLPRDAYSEWMNADGMPVWNPTFGTTGAWRLLNDTTYHPVAANGEANAPTASNPGFPAGLYPNFNTFWARPSAYVDDGIIQRYEMNRVSNSNAPGFNSNYRYSETGDIIRRGGNAFGEPPLILYQMRGVSDKSQYDWSSINFLAPNNGKDKSGTYNLELEQWFLQSQRQQLALQLGFYREEIDRFDHNFLSRTDGATPIVAVDINEFYMDGTPNPYFLRPYIGASEARINSNWQTNDNYRATLAYRLDFTHEEGWKKWLGHHSFAGYGEWRRLLSTSVYSRDKNTTNYFFTSANDAASQPLRGATYNLYNRYYVGGPVTDPGPIVDYAPSAPRNVPGTVDFIWYGNGSRTPILDKADLDNTIIVGGGSNLREIRTGGATWQGFFFNDRIVPTIGWRKDKQAETTSRSLNSNNPATSPTSTIDPTTQRHDLSYLNVWPNDWVKNEGTTRTKGIVVKPLSWLNLHYNESDSFVPAAFAYDIFLRQLPNPTGNGKDYGFSVNLFDGKLIAKINRYQTTELNSRSGATGGAFATRTFRFFFDTGGNGLSGYNADTRTFSNGLDPFDLEQVGAQWLLQTRPDLARLNATDPAQASAQAQTLAVDTWLKQFGFDQAYMDQVRDIGGGRFAEVNTVTSTGLEFELNYNPSPNWTVKVTAAQQKAIDTDLSNNINGFFDANLDAMKAIVIPSDPILDANGSPVLDANGNQTFLPGAGTLWWNHAFTSGSTGSPQTWYFTNIKTTLTQASANAGKPRPQTREWRFSVNTNFRLRAITDNKWFKPMSVGGALRWEDQAAVGYFGDAPNPDANGAVVGYDPTRPIFDKARTYFDLLAIYDLRLFNDRTKCRLQLNVRNVFENGRLQAFVYNPDGTPWNYRIIDPRQFILTATFDL